MAIHHLPQKTGIAGPSRILVSLGTVITDPYLWNKNDSLRTFVFSLLDRLYKLSVTTLSHVEFVFVLPKHIEFKRFNHSRITRFESIDQMKLLSDVPFRVLITHGGNNSIQEALIFRIPMLIIPFFGDQHETADWIVQQKLGLSIPLRESAISTESEKDRNLDHLESHLQELLSWRRARFSVTGNISLSPYSLLLQRIPFQDGDVLLGCNADRHKYIKIFETEQPDEFGFSLNPQAGNGHRWKIYRDYPLLLDNYTDMIRGYYGHDDTHPDVIHILQLVALAQPKNLIKTCLTLMDVLLKLGKQLHFVMEAYDPDSNFFTLVEFSHILRNWNHLIGKQIHFYVLTESNRIYPINIYQHEYGKKTIDHLRKACYFPKFENVSYRVKTLKSLIDNLERGNRLSLVENMFHDVIGLRLLVRGALPRNTIESVWTTSPIIWSQCDNGFLYAAHMQLNSFTELQIWSVTMYAGLHIEHDTIYKKKGFLTQREQDESAKLRQAQNARVAKNLFYTHQQNHVCEDSNPKGSPVHS